MLSTAREPKARPDDGADGLEDGTLAFAAAPGQRRRHVSHVRSDLPRSLLPVSGADAVQVAQRLVIERHAFGGQVLPQVGGGAEKAAAALAAVDDALDPASAGTWPLRLGHAWSALGSYTTPLLRRWEQAHPQTPLQLLRIDDRTAGLTQGKVDIAILREPIIVPGVHSQQLLTETRMAAVPADSALAGRPSLTLADLADHPVALNTISGTTTPDLWPHGTGPTSTVTVANTDDWLATIAAGRAVGITSSATASLHPHPTVAYLPLTDAPDITVHLAWRQPPSHPAVPDLIALAREVVATG